MDKNETKVNVNIFAYPARRYITHSYTEYKYTKKSIKVNISQAKFLSKGKFEDSFLALIKKLIEKD